MFRLHPEISRLDIPARRVLRLEQSLTDVQVGMPGYPSQHATAFLCSFSSGKGVRVTVVLQLHRSGQLAFFFNEGGEVPVSEGTRIYQQALDFAESMGFMFGDLDIHLKTPEERSALWTSLPLHSGLAASPQPAAPNIPAKIFAAAAAGSPGGKSPAPAVRTHCGVPPASAGIPAGKDAAPPPAKGPVVMPAATPLPSVPVPAAPAGEGAAPLPVESVAHAAVRPASAAELAAKRKDLRENLGRFLASF